MKAPKEVKLWISKVRSRHGKRNGVIKWLWENPEMERKLAKNKRLATPTGDNIKRD